MTDQPLSQTLATVKHPAKFTDSILDILKVELDAVVAERGQVYVLDPFAGTGRIHRLYVPGLIDTVGIEIEPEWAAMHPRTLVGNALDLPTGRDSFDVVITSPTYGNRLADHHNAKDGSIRHSYKHDLGRDLHPDNSGQLHFPGQKYEEFHRKAWAEVYRVLKPGGYFMLNISDFIKKGEVVHVCQWHLDVLHDRFKVVKRVEIPTPRLRFGQNASARVSHEFVLIMRKDK